MNRAFILARVSHIEMLPANINPFRDHLIQIRTQTVILDMLEIAIKF